MVLCIEDDRLLRTMITDVLRADDFLVAEAENGRDGLQAVLKHRPDLVLCDIMMPQMDGYEFVRRLREGSFEFSGLPVVFLTALGGRDQIIEGQKMEIDDYITKPIDFELLKSTILMRLAQVARIRGIGYPRGLSGTMP